MRRRVHFAGAICAGLLWVEADCTGGVVFEITSPYHHIRVVDEGSLRTLSFDGSAETRMSLQNPLQGHFEYTEYFHMPWLWNRQLTNVLMIGLGGASSIDRVEVWWPATGETNVISGMEMDRFYQFTEGQKAAQPLSPPRFSWPTLQMAHDHSH